MRFGKSFKRIIDGILRDIKRPLGVIFKGRCCGILERFIVSGSGFHGRRLGMANFGRLENINDNKRKIVIKDFQVLGIGIDFFIEIFNSEFNMDFFMISNYFLETFFFGKKNEFSEFCFS